MNKTITVRNVDIDLLRCQQLSLLDLQLDPQRYRLWPGQKTSIDGLINFIDACIDAADEDTGLGKCPRCNSSLMYDEEPWAICSSPFCGYHEREKPNGKI